jgi:hypothetical protein
MTNEHDQNKPALPETGPDAPDLDAPDLDAPMSRRELAAFLPAILSVQLAERSVQTCIARGNYAIPADEVVAEMRALMYYAEDTDLEMLLAQQGQALNVLFHHALTEGADTAYLGNCADVLRLALDAQRHCRHTIETVTRSRARREGMEERKNRKRNDSSRPSGAALRYDDPFAPHKMPGYKKDDD